MIANVVIEEDVVVACWNRRLEFRSDRAGPLLVVTRRLSQNFKVPQSIKGHKFPGGCGLRSEHDFNCGKTGEAEML